MIIGICSVLFRDENPRDSIFLVLQLSMVGMQSSANRPISL